MNNITTTPTVPQELKDVTPLPVPGLRYHPELKAHLSPQMEDFYALQAGLRRQVEDLQEANSQGGTKGEKASRTREINAILATIKANEAIGLKMQGEPEHFQTSGFVLYWQAFTQARERLGEIIRKRTRYNDALLDDPSGTISYYLDELVSGQSEEALLVEYFDELNSRIINQYFQEDGPTIALIILAAEERAIDLATHKLYNSATGLSGDPARIAVKASSTAFHMTIVNRYNSGVGLTNEINYFGRLVAIFSEKGVIAKDFPTVYALR